MNLRVHSQHRKALSSFFQLSVMVDGAVAGSADNNAQLMLHPADICVLDAGADAATGLLDLNARIWKPRGGLSGST